MFVQLLNRLEGIIESVNQSEPFFIEQANTNVMYQIHCNNALIYAHIRHCSVYLSKKAPASMVKRLFIWIPVLTAVQRHRRVCTVCLVGSTGVTGDVNGSIQSHPW